MPRYATIELNSGYVWWVGDAADPKEACRMSDQEGREEPSSEYIRISQSQIDGDGGYAVYEAPSDFDVSDGQDETFIAAVQELPFEGFYRGDNVPTDAAIMEWARCLQQKRERE